MKKILLFIIIAGMAHAAFCQDSPQVQNILERNWSIFQTNNATISIMVKSDAALKARLVTATAAIQQKRAMLAANPDTSKLDAYNKGQVDNNNPNDTSLHHADDVYLGNLSNEIATYGKAIAYQKLLFMNANRASVEKYVSSK